ncbi:hypothetical protein ACQ4PT_071837 [Festuca glaucescens]
MELPFGPIHLYRRLRQIGCESQDPWFLLRHAHARASQEMCHCSGAWVWRGSILLENVANLLARQVGCTVLAFDRPGWGLTTERIGKTRICKIHTSLSHRLCLTWPAGVASGEQEQSHYLA